MTRAEFSRSTIRGDYPSILIIQSTNIMSNGKLTGISNARAAKGGGYQYHNFYANLDLNRSVKRETFIFSILGVLSWIVPAQLTVHSTRQVFIRINITKKIKYNVLIRSSTLRASVVSSLLVKRTQRTGS